MPFAEMRPITGYCEHFEKGIKNDNKKRSHLTPFFVAGMRIELMTSGL